MPGAASSALGVYQWVQKPMSDRAVEDERLLALIRDSYTASGKVYGSPRVLETCARRENNVANIGWLG
ncbi:putative transposase [Nitrosospira sp. Nl5]|nr:putative transposase [Nitrosospira sp. Nl5]